MKTSSPFVSNRRDPTRTITLRRAYAQALTARFLKLKKLIWQRVVEEDFLRLGKGPGLLSVQQGHFDFTTDAGKLAAFMEWLGEMVTAGVLETGAREGARLSEVGAVPNIYIRRAYDAGVKHANQALKVAGLEVGGVGEIIGVLNAPIHADALALLYSRNFNELKGITDAMSQQVGRTLAEGLAQGKGPREIAKLIAERVDKIGITRARLIARTEVIRAHAEATLNRYQQFGIKGVTALTEFRTAGDDKVCEQCRGLETRDNGFGGGVYTLEQARGLIPVHPRCRCVWLPVPLVKQLELTGNIFVSLTRRETQILQLISEGFTNNQVADNLVVSVNTIKKHTSNIYQKLGASNRMQAVLEAKRRNLI